MKETPKLWCVKAAWNDPKFDKVYKELARLYLVEEEDHLAATWFYYGVDSVGVNATAELDCFDVLPPDKINLITIDQACELLGIK